MDLNKPHLRYKNQTRRERTWTIHFISAEKVLKATIVVVIAFKLLSLLGQDVHAAAADFVSRHGIDAANRYVHDVLERLTGVGNNQLVEFSTVAFIYASLLYIEGIGLWLQKRWAEYLTIIATALFIPVEIFEMYERFTWIRLAIFAINIFIVWYLSTRLKDEKKEVGEENIESAAVKVKICGITNLEDALLAAKCGTDELGFNFYEKSPRYISPNNARKIIDKLASNIWKVGVFVNEPIERVLDIANIAGLDAVQLHGDEGHDYVTELHKRTNKEIIKAVRVTPEFDLANVIDFDAHAILLDGFSKDEYGGTGKTFDWKIAKDARTMIGFLYLAGGITTENVRQAIREVRPYAIDVCSSIESLPGKKDKEKLQDFMAEIKRND